MSPQRITRLAGSYEELSGDGCANIERAARVERQDGGIEYLIHETDPDHPWEARLTSKPGSRTFVGNMSSDEWEDEYKLELELWESPDDDEILLLGVCWSEDEELEIKIVLWEEEEEADDER